MNMFDLFVTFFKIGILSFGGGIAMLPMFKKELVNNKAWLTEDELMDYFAVSQCTPGVIAVNSATFTGNKVGGFWGAFAATAGVVAPSILVISLLSSVIEKYQYLPAVVHAFSGARVCVCVLILNAFVSLAKKNLKDFLSVGIFATSFVLAAFLGVSPMILVPVAALLGAFVGNKKEVNK